MLAREGSHELREVLLAADSIAPIPCGDDGAPVFQAPWEAQAFAMTLALHARELFTWPEWASVLAAEVKRAQAAGDHDDGSTYYRHWLAAVERLVIEKGATTSRALDERRAAWDRAAHATPHGQPIILQNDPLSARTPSAP
jgi:nitrile hydratase accessory protein